MDFDKIRKDLDAKYAYYRDQGHPHLEAKHKAADDVHGSIWHTLPPDHEEPEPHEELLDYLDNYIKEDAPTMSMGGGIASRDIPLGSKHHLVKRALIASVLGKVRARKRTRHF